jgi:hypothetical protein
MPFVKAESGFSLYFNMALPFFFGPLPLFGGG